MKLLWLDELLHMSMASIITTHMNRSYVDVQPNHSDPGWFNQKPANTLHAQTKYFDEYLMVKL